MTFDRFDRLEAYTNNTLSAKEREQMDQELALDPAFRDDLADYQRFRYDLESITLKQQLEQIHTQLDQQGELENPTTPKSETRERRLWPIWAVAATIALVIGFALYWNIHSSLSEQVFTAYYKPEPVARGETDCSPELRLSIQAYRRTDYPLALLEVEKIPVNQPCVRYYRGLIQLAMKKPTRAIVELEQVVASVPAESDLTYQKAEWYLAMAYLSANEPDKARQQLQKISGYQNHPFRNEAQKALRNLK